jgi:ERCC4-type nuclease
LRPSGKEAAVTSEEVVREARQGAANAEDEAETPLTPAESIVVADHRETASGVIDALKQMRGVVVRVAPLKLGDYLLNNACLFERKTLPDFAASIKDGRLFAQANRLAAWPDRAAIIIEGTSQDLNASSMRREALLGARISLTLVYDLPVLRSREPAETARLLVYAADQLQRHAEGALPRHGKRPRAKRRVQLRLLQGLPGIGPARAARLLERFERVEAVMTASTESLRTVDGIGAKTAASIRWALE